MKIELYISLLAEYKDLELKGSDHIQYWSTHEGRE